MECARVFCSVNVLTITPVILNFITITLAAKLLEPEKIVLFPGDKNKLQVDYRNDHSLESQPGSLNLHFYKHHFDKIPNKHYFRSFSETNKNECLKFDDSLIRHEISRFCVDINDSTWNGGVIDEKWPLNKHEWNEREFVTKTNQSVIEYYFFNSQGYFFYIDETVPLYVSISSKQMCFTAKANQPPYYKPDNTLSMKFHVCKFNNAREAHNNAIQDFLGKPENTPYNYKSIVKNPILSIRNKNLLDMNTSIIQSYVNNTEWCPLPFSTLEFDNQWENWNDNFEFNQTKYNKLRDIVKGLKNNNINISLWVTPFINVGCEKNCVPSNEKDYFLKNTSNITVIKTWSGRDAYHIDFTNPNASYWWANATQKLLTESDINTLVFVGGESSWYPEHPTFYVNGSSYPDNINAYLKTMKRVGNSTHYKSSRRSQKYGHFLRLLDYNTEGNMSLKLSMLVSSVTNSNMLGYPFVIPHMIDYQKGQRKIKSELYIRWMQAVTFMPAIQFSYPPWDFNQETQKKFKNIMNIRKNHINTIIKLMEKSVTTGSPLNPPIWWIDPTDTTAHSIDDEYLLGENILVAPVIVVGAVSRNIYFPAGLWRDENYSNKPYIRGRTWFYNYSAPLDVLPWFTRILYF